MSDEHQRRWLVRTVVAVLVTVAVVVGGPWVYATFLLREPPEPLMLATVEPTPTVPSGVVPVDGTWEVQEGSEAGYRLDEVLSGQEVTVVGRTDAVSGEVVVEEGLITSARISVDVGSITTDEAARDAYFRRAMDTTSYPAAVFTITEPVDISAIGQSPEPLTVEAEGTLTMGGVTQPATATLDAQRTVDGVAVAAVIDILLADFDLIAPDLGWVSVEPAGSIEAMVLLAR